MFVPLTVYHMYLIVIILSFQTDVHVSSLLVAKPSRWRRRPTHGPPFWHHFSLRQKWSFMRHSCGTSLCMTSSRPSRSSWRLPCTIRCDCCCIYSCRLPLRSCRRRLQRCHVSRYCVIESPAPRRRHVIFCRSVLLTALFIAHATFLTCFSCCLLVSLGLLSNTSTSNAVSDYMHVM